MNPAQLSFTTDLVNPDLGLPPSLATRRTSGAVPAQHERREEIREHARQRAMVQESVMRHNRELKPS